MKCLGQKIIGATALLALALGAIAQEARPLGSLPLWFEPVQAGKFMAHGERAGFTIAADGAGLQLANANGQSDTGRLMFAGANPNARISGEAPLQGRVNYLFGNDASAWRSGIPTFARVRITDIYPGVDVVFYGNQQKLEYDFNLAASVDPAVIKLQFSGAEKVAVNAKGELVVQFHSGQIIQHVPLVYQTAKTGRRTISATYKVIDRQTATFALGNYDARLPLVIDPVLTYSTYYGGNYGEKPWAIALNLTDGSVYVAGQTFSTQFTNGIAFSTPGAYLTNYQGGKVVGDAFVARFDNSGTNLIYATYLGGNGDDAAYALAVDAAGNAYVAGATYSTNFPVTNSIPGGNKISGQIIDSLKTYPTDGFVTKLDSSGANLVYSSYIGGNSSEAVYGIALDSNNDVFITGFTYSTNFPVTADAFQPQLMCSNTFTANANAFVSEIASNGTNLTYSTYLGGTNFDVANSIAFNNHRVFVAGYTWSTNFPNTNHLAGYDHLNGRTNKLNYGSDMFVTAFDTSLTNWSLLYSTLLGGSNIDVATSVAASADGSAYVAGYTTSTNFPCTVTNVASLPPAFLVTNKNYVLATNCTLTQIKWDGTQPSIGFSSVFGGRGFNVANGVALDPAGNIYLVGSASCTNMPVTTNNISGFLSATNSSQKNKGYSDAFVTVFNHDATALLYSAYLGGYLQDYGNAIAVDPVGNAYIAGQTLSADFPTVNARQTYRNGTNDMFIAKISQNTSAPVLAIAPQTVAPPGISLTWQMFPPNYNIEASADVATGPWSAVPQSPVYSNGWYQLTLPATNAVEFFRLHQF